MYNHMVGRTASVMSPFYSLLPGKDTEYRYSDLGAKNLMTGYRYENQLQNPGLLGLETVLSSTILYVHHILLQALYYYFD